MYVEVTKPTKVIADDLHYASLDIFAVCHLCFGRFFCFFSRSHRRNRRNYFRYSVKSYLEQGSKGNLYKICQVGSRGTWSESMISTNTAPSVREVKAKSENKYFCISGRVASPRYGSKDFGSFLL
ncbi:hypothetical protein, unlikely [Trypanosoma brucei gambiense DAL972]|uniref:Uncharacterized protein n=1 Tax=Trypanosoma brucei gambiense (strain MHOM/CI/86/DAL972) TaxID=679716 RepID=D0A0L9_TRYB9|nr:hypothetical protein, unlikely [Trypanosoma brucei gambiense DAL972]CBH16777.1 hypothetical protein, unlikely [Trypanosoma brucei gambiense DAL972]|eukprot:XP_011779041.1 hypothetical protein, unlikely [Trypanosoma brucei gambiense DAL972]